MYELILNSYYYDKVDFGYIYNEGEIELAYYEYI